MRIPMLATGAGWIVCSAMWASTVSADSGNCVPTASANSQAKAGGQTASASAQAGFPDFTGPDSTGNNDGVVNQDGTAPSGPETGGGLAAPGAPAIDVSANLAALRAASLDRMDLRLGINSKTIIQNAAGAATSPVTPAGPPAGTPPPAAGGPLDPISKILKSRHLATILGLLNLGTGNPLAIVNSVLDIVKAVAGIAGQGATDVSLSPEDEAFLKANAQELVDALQTEKEKLDQAKLAQSQAATAQAAAEKDRQNRYIDWQIQQLQQQKQP